VEKVRQALQSTDFKSLRRHTELLSYQSAQKGPTPPKSLGLLPPQFRANAVYAWISGTQSHILENTATTPVGFSARLHRSHVPKAVSHRGIKGGYVLARNPELIPLTEIIFGLEGPFALTQCSSGIADLCDLESSCPVRGQPANHQPGDPGRSRTGDAFGSNTTAESDRHSGRKRAIWYRSLAANLGERNDHQLARE
jgi:hypothetical protein